MTAHHGKTKRRRRLLLWPTLTLAAVGLSVLIAWYQEWRWQQVAGSPTVATFNAQFSEKELCSWGDNGSRRFVETICIGKLGAEQMEHFSGWLPHSEPPAWALRPTPTSVSMATTVSGWPFRCLRRYQTHAGTEEQAICASVFPSANAAFTLLPTGLYLPGLLANVALFMGLAVPMLTVPPLVRRRLRRRRWACVGCGYHLGYGPLDQVCPECGLAQSSAK